MRFPVKIVLLLALFVSLAAGGAMANTLPFEEREPDGFRDIPWGAPASQVEGLKFSAEGTTALRELYKRTKKQAAGQVSVYSRPTDRLKIGDASLSRIYYYFYDDLFYGATAYFAGRENYDKLLAACYRKFGEPTLTEADRVEWQGQSTTIVLSQKGFFSIDSEEIKDKMEEPEGF